MKIVKHSEEIFEESKLLRVNGRNVSKDSLNPLNSGCTSHGKGGLLGWPTPSKGKQLHPGKETSLLCSGEIEFSLREKLSRLQRKEKKNPQLIPSVNTH